MVSPTLLAVSAPAHRSRTGCHCRCHCSWGRRPLPPEGRYVRCPSAPCPSSCSSRTHAQTRSRSTMWAPSLTARSSTLAGIGASLALSSFPCAPDASLDSGEPFKTTIGVGQVIKGWDEGTSSPARVHLLSVAQSIPIVVSGVPQLSLGEKAVLTATPDYVSPCPVSFLSPPLLSTTYTQ